MPQDTIDQVRLIEPANRSEAMLQREFLQLTELVTSGRANRQQRRKHQRVYEKMKRAGLAIVEHSALVEAKPG